MTSSDTYVTATSIPTLPNIPVPSTAGPKTTSAVITPTLAQNNFNQQQTAATGITQAVQAQTAANAGKPSQDPVIQAAQSDIPFQQLLTNNPAAAYYRATGRLPSPGSTQELANFVAQQNQNPSKGLSDQISKLTNAIQSPSISNVDISGDGTTVSYTDSNGQHINSAISNVQGTQGVYVNGQFTPLSSLGGQSNSTQGQSGLNSYTNGLQSTADAQLQALNNANTQIAQIQSGTFPLNAAQQAQLDSVRQRFGSLIEQQKVANKAYEQGTQTANIASGRSEHFREIASGLVANAVNVGIEKIADLNNSMTNALADLQRGFDDQNYKMVDAVYARMNKYLGEKTQTLKDIYDATIKFQADQREAVHQQLEDQMNADKFDFQKQQATIDNAFKAQQIGMDEKKMLEQKLNNDRDYQLKLKEFSHKLQQDSLATSGGGDEFGSLQIAAQEYAATGKMPTWISKGDASKVAILSQTVKQPPGRLVDALTGRPSSQLSPTQEQGIIALNDVIKKLDAAKEAFGGVYSGLFGKLGNLNPSDNRIIYDSLKSEIVALLNQARSGQAVTEQEYARAVNKLPGYMNNTLGIGTNGVDKIQQLKNSLEGTLKNNLTLNGLAVTDSHQINQNSTQTLQTLYANPQKAQQIDQILKDHPDFTAEDVVQLIGN